MYQVYIHNRHCCNVCNTCVGVRILYVTHIYSSIMVLVVYSETHIIVTAGKAIAVILSMAAMDIVFTLAIWISG